MEASPRCGPGNEGHGSSGRVLACAISIARDTALRKKLAGRSKAVFCGHISWALRKDVRCAIAGSWGFIQAMPHWSLQLRGLAAHVHTWL